MRVMVGHLLPASGCVEKCTEEATTGLVDSARVSGGRNEVPRGVLNTVWVRGHSSQQSPLSSEGSRSESAGPTLAAKNAARMGHPPKEIKIPTLSQKERQEWGTRISIWG